MMTSPAYWQSLDKLMASSEVIIARPKGAAHPRFPAMIYPLDYGYLQDTSSSDGMRLTAGWGACLNAA
ncbi:MAG TPA: hypothetical protein PLZ36_09555 [Armatimonadota bacterium]|nr:hypothetical protein [Armatimonadota bacterium]